MQICQFYSDFYPISIGGVETWIYSASNFLSNYYDNLYFSLITDRRYILPFLHKNVPKFQHYGNLKVHRLGVNIPRIVLFALQYYARVPKPKLERIQRIVARELFLEAAKIREVREADVFHAHTLGGTDPMQIAIREQLPLELSSYFGKPLIVQLHGTFFPGPEAMSFTNEKRKIILKNADAIITHNMNVFEQLKRWNLQKKTSLIPIGIDLIRFGNRKREFKKNGLTIAFVGRLSAYRDPITAICAFNLLLNRIPEAKLQIVGSGPLENQVRLLVHQLNIGESVFMHGAIKDVDSYLQKSDVFWAMSPINNYPSSSMLEALASGLPVVATDTGMTRELIVHRQNGLLVSPQNPREVANATEEILTGNRFRKALSINARATAEKYDIRVVLPRIAQLYHSLAMKETMI